MTTTYHCTCDGEDMGVFHPIRWDRADGASGIGYQGTDPKTGALLGILWSDRCYDDPTRNGNIEWEICEETTEHRHILELAGEPWDDLPMCFTLVTEGASHA